MSILRDHLAAEVEKKVRRGGDGIVVWDDPGGTFTSVAAGVVPAGMPFERFDGSWWDLRRRVEPHLERPDPGALVVYVHGVAPAQDPLLELRMAAKHPKWMPKLSDLVRAGLKDHVPPARLEALARQARSFAEAEVAAEGGVAQAGRLLTVLDALDPVGMAAALMSGTCDARVTADDAWNVVGTALDDAIGLGLAPEAARPSGSAMGDGLRRRIATQVVLSAILASGGPLPEPWSHQWVAPGKRQADARKKLLEHLTDPRRLAVWSPLADLVDADLDVAGELQWCPGLQPVGATRAIDAVAKAFALGKLVEGSPIDALAVAAARLQHSPWLTEPDAQAEWDLLRRLARLATCLQTFRPAPGLRASQLLSWYAAEGFEVDRAFRLVERARSAVSEAHLDEQVDILRRRYLDWLDHVHRLTTAGIAGSATGAAGSSGLSGPTLLAQTEVWTHIVEPQRQHGKVAYMLVDALRYELGASLAEALASHLSPEAVTLRPAVTAAPTITPVGMAALLPGAERSFAIELPSRAGADEVAVVAGVRVTCVADRLTLLRHAVGPFLDLDLNALMGSTNKALKAKIASADIVLVRSGEIDSTGESRHGGTVWRAISGITEDLATQVQRLLSLGVASVVIAADHGFHLLPEPLGTAHVSTAPEGEGSSHRRGFVGRAATVPEASVTVALAALGVAGGLDLVTPRGLTLFQGHGSRQFFHGGLSPQELVIPVLVVHRAAATAPAAASKAAKVRVSIGGQGITTGVFSVSLSFDANMFETEVAVRVIGRADGRTIARVLAGDIADPQAGTVVVSAEARQITFKIDADLSAGSDVELVVSDARNGLELVRHKVPVLADVKVDLW